MHPGASEMLGQLTDEQRSALLAQLRARRSEAGGDRIVAVGRTEPAPLSFAQQRLWFLHRWTEGSPVYNSPLALRLRGPLDIDALSAALHTLVSRHESLRTHYIQTADGPRQLIGPAPARSPLQVADLTRLTAQEQQAEERRRTDEAAREPFDLSADLMLRAVLLSKRADDHLLILVVHHIATDGWSTALMMSELGECYLAATQGRSPDLPALRVQYADYAAWQRHRMAGPAGTASLAYWRAQLAGLTSLDFPADHPRPKTPTWAGDVVHGLIPAAVHRDLAALSGGQAPARLLPVALAGFSALLSRYSGQDDIAVGSVFSGRTRTELESLVGYFASTVVLRVSTQGDPSFRELLARAEQTVLDAHAHQDVEFDQLVGELRPDRDASRNPLFQVALWQVDAEPDAARMGDIELEPVRLHTGTARFDCTLTVAERPSGDIELSAEYATELFDRDRMSRMLVHLRQLVTSAAAQPDVPVSQLDLLTPAERAEIGLANATAVRRPPSEGIHAEFAAQAARTPDSVAVAHRDTELTYQELSRRADQIASHLTSCGAGPGTLVGVCLRRSADLPACLLGVLKTGAAYLPLDAEYPRARLEFLLADAQPVVIAIDETTGERLAAAAGGLGEGAPRLAMLPSDESAGQPADQRAAAVRGDCLAYVTYTSGSTGQPKGVMISHEQVLNLFTAVDRLIGDDAPGTWLAVSSASFDISVIELLWTLARGYKVVIADAHPDRQLGRSRGARPGRMDFSLFYFASDDDADAHPGSAKYRLLIEGARFADQHGFAAVWTPERHFHAFGGRYPSPSVISAALAMVTSKVALRAGSVVAPLHHPVRMAEEWSVVDNLSDGRIGLSFASGWHHDDFVFAPGSYQDRKAVMLTYAETVRTLWRGDAVAMPGGTGAEVEVRIRPRPVQPELPVWLTAAGSEQTFTAAGERGMGVLTHLLGQDLADLARKIELYRAAWRERSGSDGGNVTVMMHAFVGDDTGEVRRVVRDPFIGYLRTSLDLVRVLGQRLGVEVDPANISDDDLDVLLGQAFDRYVGTSGLFGTPGDCQLLVAELAAIGVDEIACLIDFGVSTDEVLASLPHLETLRRLSNQPGQETAPDDSLGELMLRHGVTHLQCTPTLAALLCADEDAAAGLAGLTSMLIGGEALPSALAERLRETTAAAIYNMYGPTETTVWSLSCALPAGADDDATVPIGRPLANTTAYVLDRWGAPAPVGLTGELYLGGAGVGVGYHRRPQLTAERFVPDPFAPANGAGTRRMYRTGDLCRRLPSGLISFLHRADHQVKLRGYRIEPGEIEAALLADPAVNSAIVVPRGEGAACQLVAYLVGDAGERTGQAELRDALRERLPEFMIPAHFVWLDAFPLTTSGKIDRDRLPEPGHKPVLPPEPPRTDKERAIAQVWSEVLGLTEVGIRDNFFELGGHSISVVLAVDKASKLGFRFSARQLFEHPTIAGLAALSAAAPEPPESQEPAAQAPAGGTVRITPIRAGADLPPLICLHSSAASAVPYLPLAAHLPEHRPCYVIEADDDLGDDVTVDSLAARYAVALTDRYPASCYHLAGWSLGGVFAWAVASRLEEIGARVALLALIDTEPVAVPPWTPDRAAMLGWFARNLALSAGQDLASEPVAVPSGATPGEQEDSIMNALEEAGLVPAGQRELILTGARQFVTLHRAVAAWRPTSFSGPVDLLVSEDNGDAAPAVEGWRRHATGQVRARRIPGNHFTMLRPPHVAALASALRELMWSAEQPSAHARTTHGGS